jgi:hypothetical protein
MSVVERLLLSRRKSTSRWTRDGGGGGDGDLTPAATRVTREDVVETAGGSPGAVDTVARRAAAAARTDAERAANAAIAAIAEAEEAANAADAAEAAAAAVEPQAIADAEAEEAAAEARAASDEAGLYVKNTAAAEALAAIVDARTAARNNATVARAAAARAEAAAKRARDARDEADSNAARVQATEISVKAAETAAETASKEAKIAESAAKDARTARTAAENPRSKLSKESNEEEKGDEESEGGKQKEEGENREEEGEDQQAMLESPFVSVQVVKVESSAYELYVDGHLEHVATVDSGSDTLHADVWVRAVKPRAAVRVPRGRSLAKVMLTESLFSPLRVTSMTESGVSAPAEVVVQTVQTETTQDESQSLTRRAHDAQLAMRETVVETCTVSDAVAHAVVLPRPLRVKPLPCVKVATVGIDRARGEGTLARKLLSNLLPALLKNIVSSRSSWDRLITSGSLTDVLWAASWSAFFDLPYTFVPAVPLASVPPSASVPPVPPPASVPSVDPNAHVQFSWMTAFLISIVGGRTSENKGKRKSVLDVATGTWDMMVGDTYSSKVLPWLATLGLGRLQALVQQHQQRLRTKRNMRKYSPTQLARLLDKITLLFRRPDVNTRPTSMWGLDSDTQNLLHFFVYVGRGLATHPLGSGPPARKPGVKACAGHCPATPDWLFDVSDFDRSVRDPDATTPGATDYLCETLARVTVSDCDRCGSPFRVVFDLHSSTSRFDSHETERNQNVDPVRHHEVACGMDRDVLALQHAAVRCLMAVESHADAAPTSGVLSSLGEVFRFRDVFMRVWKDRAVMQELQKASNAGRRTARDGAGSSVDWVALLNEMCNRHEVLKAMTADALASMATLLRNAESADSWFISVYRTYVAQGIKQTLLRELVLPTSVGQRYYEAVSRAARANVPQRRVSPSEDNAVWTRTLPHDVHVGASLSSTVRLNDTLAVAVSSGDVETPATAEASRTVPSFAAGVSPFARAVEAYNAFVAQHNAAMRVVTQSVHSSVVLPSWPLTQKWTLSKAAVTKSVARAATGGSARRFQSVPCTPPDILRQQARCRVDEVDGMVEEEVARPTTDWPRGLDLSAISFAATVCADERERARESATQVAEEADDGFPWGLVRSDRARAACRVRDAATALRQLSVCVRRHYCWEDHLFVCTTRGEDVRAAMRCAGIEILGETPEPDPMLTHGVVSPCRRGYGWMANVPTAMSVSEQRQRLREYASALEAVATAVARDGGQGALLHDQLLACAVRVGNDSTDMGPETDGLAEATEEAALRRLNETRLSLQTPPVAASATHRYLVPFGHTVGTPRPTSDVSPAPELVSWSSAGLDPGDPPTEGNVVVTFDPQPANAPTTVTITATAGDLVRATCAYSQPSLVATLLERHMMSDVSDARVMASGRHLSMVWNAERALQCLVHARGVAGQASAAVLDHDRSGLLEQCQSSDATITVVNDQDWMPKYADKLNKIYTTVAAVLWVETQNRESVERLRVELSQTRRCVRYAAWRAQAALDLLRSGLEHKSARGEEEEEGKSGAKAAEAAAASTLDDRRKDHDKQQAALDKLKRKKRPARPNGGGSGGGRQLNDMENLLTAREGELRRVTSVVEALEKTTKELIDRLQGDTGYASALLSSRSLPSYDSGQAAIDAVEEQWGRMEEDLDKVTAALTDAGGPSGLEGDGPILMTSAHNLTRLLDSFTERWPSSDEPASSARRQPVQPRAWDGLDDDEVDPVWKQVHAALARHVEVRIDLNEPISGFGLRTLTALLALAAVGKSVPVKDMGEEIERMPPEQVGRFGVFVKTYEGLHPLKGTDGNDGASCSSLSDKQCHIQKLQQRPDRDNLWAEWKDKSRNDRDNDARASDNCDDMSAWAGLVIRGTLVFLSKAGYEQLVAVDYSLDVDVNPTKMKSLLKDPLQSGTQLNGTSTLAEKCLSVSKRVAVGVERWRSTPEHTSGSSVSLTAAVLAAMERD